MGLVSQGSELFGVFISPLGTYGGNRAYFKWLCYWFSDIQIIEKNQQVKGFLKVEEVQNVKNGSVEEKSKQLLQM